MKRGKIGFFNILSGCRDVKIIWAFNIWVCVLSRVQSFKQIITCCLGLTKVDDLNRLDCPLILTRFRGTEASNFDQLTILKVIRNVHIKLVDCSPNFAEIVRISVEEFNTSEMSEPIEVNCVYH